MFKWLDNKIKFYRLYRAEKELEKQHSLKQAEAKEKKEPALLEDWECNYGDHVYADIRWSRKKLVSDALLSEADELYLPRPLYSDKTKWDDEADEYGMPRGAMVLTPEAITELRSAIRKDRKERREVIEWRVKLLGGILTLFTGLVGALIGLASVLRHK